MIDEFLPLAVRQIRVHLEPINVRSGPERLRALCVAELGREPEPTEAFLFVNKARDVLVVYCGDSSGDLLDLLRTAPAELVQAITPLRRAVAVPDERVSRFEVMFFSSDAEAP